MKVTLHQLICDNCAHLETLRGLSHSINLAGVTVQGQQGRAHPLQLYLQKRDVCAWVREPLVGGQDVGREVALAAPTLIVAVVGAPKHGPGALGRALLLQLPLIILLHPHVGLLDMPKNSSSALSGPFG